MSFTEILRQLIVVALSHDTKLLNASLEARNALHDLVCGCQRRFIHY